MFACPPKALEDIRFAEEQAQRDFRRAESAERLQSQYQSGILRDRLVATNEKHSQQIVTNLISKSRGRRIIGRYGQFISGSVEYPQPSSIIPQGPNQVVVRDAVHAEVFLGRHRVLLGFVCAHQWGVIQKTRREGRIGHLKRSFFRCPKLSFFRWMGVIASILKSSNLSVKLHDYRILQPYSARSHFQP